MRPAHLCLLLCTLLLPLRAAQAYPWMVKHHYTGCATCHVDPAGGGVPTAYGRAQGPALVEGRVDPLAEQPPGVLWGAVTVPQWLLLGLELRAGALVSHSAAGDTRSTGVRPVQMATDLRAGVVAGGWRASASLGLALKRALSASLTRPGAQDGAKLVSREHWLGHAFLEEALLVRAGRMNVPFGIRSVEHTLWARTATRTDSNEHQQHGLGLHWGEDSARIELMALLGNYQLRPDRFRERGGAALIEWVLGPAATVGWSSLATYAREDLERGEPETLRMAHGVSSRVGLGPRLALLAEANVLLRRTAAVGAVSGVVGYAQADWELRPGLHLLGTVEVLRPDRPQPGGLQRGLWASLGWSMAHATELRLDVYARQTPRSSDSPERHSLVAILQLHLSP